MNGNQDSEKTEGGVFLRSKKKTALLLGFVAVLLVGGGFLYWQYFGPVDLSQDPDQIKSAREYFRYYEALNEAYKNDPYGGDTPEETLELFIAALERGDLEEASRYFVVNNQKNIKEDLQTLFGSENGRGGVYLGVLQMDSEGAYLTENTYEINFFDNGEQVHFERFVLNKHTGKWKMYEL